MTTWVRPSGTTINLADTPNLVEFAKSQGWTLAKSKIAVVRDAALKVKRTRRTKAEMEADGSGLLQFLVQLKEHIGK